MSHNDQLLCLLVLQRAQGIGVLSARRLLQAAGSATALFSKKKKDIARRSGLPLTKLQALDNDGLFREAEAELDFIQKNNYRILTILDEDYPKRLRECPDGPLLLFCKGRINFNNKRVISVVGSRICTAQGLENCRRLLADLSPLDPLIVSGLAFGIDICAHQAALENGLQTIACLGHGLDRVYPTVHEATLSAMCEHGGAITEFWRQDAFDPKNFVRRNRIIAGLSEAVVVVESAGKGGSLVTARMANSYNREVFAFPGRVSDPQSSGCNTLIKTERARLISSAADLVYILGWDLDQKKPSGTQTTLFPDLTEPEAKLFGTLQDGKRKHIDDMALEAGMPAHLAASLLITLELKGIVRPLPGKLFERC